MKPTPVVIACLAVLILAFGAGAGHAQDTPWPERGYDVTHRWGLGAYSSDAPASVRYFWDTRYGVDAGLGFSIEDNEGRNRTEIVLDGGFLYALAPGQRVNFFLRPGVQFRNLSAENGTTSTIRLSGAFEAEFFLTQSLSLGARTGVFVDSVSPAGSGGDRADGGTYRGFVTEAGFHFYLGRRE